MSLMEAMSYYNNLHIVYPGTYVSNGMVAIASSSTGI